MHIRGKRFVFRSLRVAAWAVLVLAPVAASAQPFGLWTSFAGNGTVGATNGTLGPTDGYLGIPNSPALNPTSAITIEAWVQVNLPFAGDNCRSIVGKGFETSYWLGICGNQLRSYISGTSSVYTSGPAVLGGPWVHVAVTSDGVTRSHYIDGELVGTASESGPPAGNSDPLEIGGDADWEYSLNGNINEVRLWNVARTQAEIQSTINVPLRAPQPGLVAVWSMGNANDALGTYNGSFVGHVPPNPGPPAKSNCGSSGGELLCLQTTFQVTAGYRISGPGTAPTAASIVNTANVGSGIFWFNNPNDWQIMVKVLDGCAINGQWWVFSAATTNLFYELSVVQVLDGQPKLYFNYPGPPAPAVTDTAAFPCS